jgi:hypothetical protein
MVMAVRRGVAALSNSIESVAANVSPCVCPNPNSCNNTPLWAWDPGDFPSPKDPVPTSPALPHCIVESIHHETPPFRPFNPARACAAQVHELTHASFPIPPIQLARRASSAPHHIKHVLVP